MLVMCSSLICTLEDGYVHLVKIHQTKHLRFECFSLITKHIFKMTYSVVQFWKDAHGTLLSTKSMFQSCMTSF